MIAISIRELTKKYGDLVAVDHLSLDIQKGELISLLGVNGAGKTTTVKMLSCLARPCEGTALIHGYDICTQSDQIKPIIGVSPQETAVAPGLSVLENLQLLCGIYGLTKDESANRINDIISSLGLEQVLHRKAGKLSGGWQRRLSIAMALVGQPTVMFLDEPTLGLDVLVRRELWTLIRSLRGKVTIILTTHYMEEAEELSDRVAIMASGKLIDCDTPSAIKQKTGCERFEDAFIQIVKEGNV